MHPVASAQHTLASSFELSGIGLHSGAEARVRVGPAAPGAGRFFVRLDQPEASVIPAQVDSVHQTVLSTELRLGEASVRTVEHLLAALAGLGVDNARIELDGPELPILDGSALPWAEAIAAVGLATQDQPRPAYVLTEPIWCHSGDAFVAALPAPQLRFSYGIEFELPAIGQQWWTWTPDSQSFLQEVAPARTFALEHQVEALRGAGLIKGGSLENALVCGTQGWLNPPLRFPNEPVRHKLLDLVGDFSLLGIRHALGLQAHILAYKASHDLHTRLVRLLAERWQAATRGSAAPEAEMAEVLNPAISWSSHAHSD
ncbi:UDP-3-O-acyl-N-acetylglucosamine deacetylase [Leptolyngbya sp. FACHB-261]|uniref:UDP-3-O-acyl-N-acetylglucosamine deacetylase n=1 Tax=Leptolyngbya sp. FACHB-261 TaxID=2692806 RepID=UPI001683A80F|nr:UDP-3-O-acyl-N-acetylglucosamine deacetylase [Leptolyngbya sp. FACHB-261]MBD2101170.1 UDP-3-O-acyl-N-acetylglucosamine deacetylase [Leptolyngbya sp. FACHB-261]